MLNTLTTLDHHHHHHRQSHHNNSKSSSSSISMDVCLAARMDGWIGPINVNVSFIQKKKNSYTHTKTKCVHTQFPITAIPCLLNSLANYYSILLGGAKTLQHTFVCLQKERGSRIVWLLFVTMEMVLLAIVFSCPIFNSLYYYNHFVYFVFQQPPYPLPL